MWTVIIAGVLTISANADTMKIVGELWANRTVRSAVMEQAKYRAQTASSAGNPFRNRLTDQEGASLGGILGWTRASLPAAPYRPGWSAPWV
jgi:hypothetical protein